MIDLIVNGVQQRIDSHFNLADLLAKMELVGQRIAVERNGEIIPRSRYGETELANGDRLEIVVAVGGG